MSERTHDEALPAEIARLNKIIQALMNRAEHNIQNSDFHLFQGAVALEELVRRRTEELEAALRENEKITLALRQSEHRYRALVENSPMCIHEIDLEGRLLSMNHAGLDMLGLDDENKICGVPYLSAVSEQDGGRIKALLQDAINGTASHFEFDSAGDAPLHFKSCFIPIRDTGGKVLKLMGLTEDITERKRTLAEIAYKNTILQTLNETTLDAMLVIDENESIIVFNQQFIDLWQLSPELVSKGLDAPVLRTVVDKVENPEAFFARVRYLYDHREEKSREEIPLRGGRVIDRYSSPITGADGKYYGRVWYFRDITERKHAEENLLITASVFDNSQEAILITDAQNAIVDVNPAFTRITGYSRREVMGKNPKLLGSGRQDQSFYTAMWRSLKQDKSWRGEIWNRRKSGEIYAELLSVSAICDADGKVQRYVGVFSDISQIKAHEAELSHAAHYDALTGIPNRALLSDRMKQAIIGTQRSGRILAVCYMDLDGFKQINDRHGHEAGDKLLVEVTHRLQAALRANDTLARLGGDEFVMLFNDLASKEECLRVLDRILDIAALPVNIGNLDVTVSASLGVTFYPEDDADGDTLLRHADQAMYVAKQSGKGQYHLFAHAN